MSDRPGYVHWVRKGTPITCPCCGKRVKVMQTNGPADGRISTHNDRSRTMCAAAGKTPDELSPPT